MNEHRLTVPRTARYLTLGEDGPEFREVWIALHGYAQLAGRFLRWLRPLDDGRTLIVAPEALSRFYLETSLEGRHGKVVGATWMTREAREDDLADHLRYLDLLAEHVLPRWPARPHLTVLGFSQGSVMAARWLEQATIRPDRVLLWGTPLPRDVSPARLAGRLGESVITLVAGEHDPVVPAGSIEADAAALRECGARAGVLRYDGGHGMQADALRAAAGRVTEP